MTTMTYADRARRFRGLPPASTAPGDEINETNAITLPPGPDSTYAPLDPVIAADVAAWHPRSEIVARVDRLTARAGRPGATALDRAVADDWGRVLAAKGTTDDTCRHVHIEIGGPTDA